MLSLLGLAGSSCASVVSWVSWLAPLMIGLSVVLLGRAHYVLCILKSGTATTTVITWVATLLVVGFWTWRLLMGAGGTALF